MYEFQIIQNYALGGLAIQSFAKGYGRNSENNLGPTIPFVMPILPMIFNEKTSQTLSLIKRNTNSRFLSTVADHRDLFVGLQKRMVDMSDQTLKTLNFAFALNLIRYDQDSSRITASKYLKKTPKIQYRDNQMIIYSARILGSWFAQYSIEEICIALNIYF